MSSKKHNYLKDLFKIATLLLLIVSLFSCLKSNDVYSNLERTAAYGTVIGDNQDARILLDDENTILNIVSYATIPIQLKNGNRVFIIFALADKDNVPAPNTSSEYNVVVFDIKNILTKDYLIQTDLTEEQDAELGADRADISNAWVSADYLNLIFYIQIADTGVSHFVNLVLDEARSTNTKKHFIFRHNAHQDIGPIQSFGRVSFNIKDIIDNMTSGSEMEIVLQWNSYHSDGKQESFIYTKK